MKKVAFGDILQLESGIIVHGCNAQGVMGSGIALQIKNRYPLAFSEYQRHLKNCVIDGVDPLGSHSWQKVGGDVYQGLYVFNAITQRNYGRDGKKYVSYEAVYKTMRDAARLGVQLGLDVHYPMIGAGFGGGDWAVISHIIDVAFQDVTTIDHTLWIYE